MNAAVKRRTRKGPEYREKLRTQALSCADLEWILRFVRKDEARPDCWCWDGPWTSSHFGAKPVVRRGEYGKMQATKAVWLALGRDNFELPHFLKTTCGFFDCVSPEHLFLSSITLERARKIMSLSLTDNDD